VSDFRDRFGEQLAAAAAAFADAPQADFRARFGAQLAAAAGELAGAGLPAPAARARIRKRRRLGVPALRRRGLTPGFGLGVADFRVRFGLQLASAAGELAARQRRERGRGRRRAPHAGRWPWLTRPVAVGLILAACAGSAFAAVAIWTPLLGNPQYGYNPGAATSAPPADQLAALAVLRRAQTDADRGALSAAALTYINDYTKGVRTAYVRLLDTVGTEAFVLVPVVQRDATAPSGTAATALANALCVYASDASAMHEHVACWSLGDVLAGRAAGLFDGELFGLAPDGMSTATLSAVGQPPLSAPVANNFFAFAISSSGAPLTSPSVSFTRG